jgi:hypothetical protein
VCRKHLREQVPGIILLLLKLNVVVKEIALRRVLKVLSGHHRMHLIKIRVCRSHGGIMRRRG